MYTTAIGNIDLDWFTDLRRTSAGPLSFIVYSIMKKYWYDENMRDHPDKKWNAPYEDYTEVNALKALRDGMGYADLFPNMAKNEIALMRKYGYKEWEPFVDRMNKNRYKPWIDPVSKCP